MLRVPGYVQEKKEPPCRNARVHDTHDPMIQEKKNHSSSHAQALPPLTHNPPPHLPTTVTMMK
jgi:hypothetical protein